MLSSELSPRELVDRQLRAYNARDIDVYASLFATHAVISNLSDGKEIGRGIDAIRKTYAARFKDAPHLHCTITARLELGAFVIDQERVTGLTEDVLEVIAIYEVRDALIHSVRFIRS